MEVVGSTDLSRGRGRRMESAATGGVSTSWGGRDPSYEQGRATGRAGSVPRARARSKASRQCIRGVAGGVRSASG